MQLLKINGTEKQFAAGQFPATLAELLAQLNVDTATVVAEVDGRIVRREHFASTKLQPGQTIELIRLMGGG